MNWETVWGFLDGDGTRYSPDFRRRMESLYAEDIAAWTGDDLAIIEKVFNQLLPPKEGAIITNPTTGWQTTTTGGKTYVRKPEITNGFPMLDASGLPMYGAWELQSEAKAEPWQLTEDALIKDTNGAVIGYYDQSGVPQALDRALLSTSPSWQLTEDALIKDANGNVVGYYDDKNIPQAIDKALLPTTASTLQQPWGADEPGRWIGNQYVKNPDYISPEDIEAQRVAQDRSDRADFLNRQQADKELAQGQQELTWNRAAQAQQNVFQPQPIYVNAEENTPSNWINYWKAGQQVGQKQEEASQKQGAINWLAASPQVGAMGTQGYAGGEAFGGYREGLDPATGQRVAWNRPEQMSAMWDPFTQSYRPETSQEWQMRMATQAVNAGTFTPEMAQQGQNEAYYNWGTNPTAPMSAWQADPQGMRAALTSSMTPQELASWQQNKETWMNEQAAAWRSPNFPSGPETPQWARGVLQNPQANINLKTLGQQGNMVRPVSAQMYQGWAPSQQQGYQGLAAAQKGVYPEDYWGNVQKMWGASRPGQMARRTTSWGY